MIKSADTDRVLSAEEYEQQTRDPLGRANSFWIPTASGAPSALTLALFRRRQLLRILLRDVQGFCTLPETTEELSNLADAILAVACRRLRADLAARYGQPRLAEPGAEECGFAVISLGKLGGKELNYSSDIDLMFLYGGNGETDGPAPITNKEFFKKLANQCIELLSTYTAEGRCYRVDLRLRPEGPAGRDRASRSTARATTIRTRARLGAADAHQGARLGGRPAPGPEPAGIRRAAIYSSTLDFSAVESMSATRERISEKLAARKGWQAGFDIKLARGGIRDIEFLVQCLQRLHGGREPWVRHGGSMLALFRLRDKDLLSDAEYSRWPRPTSSCATWSTGCNSPTTGRPTPCRPTRGTRGAGAQDARGRAWAACASAETLLAQVNRHLEEVQEIYERVVHAQQPMYYSHTPQAIRGAALAGGGAGLCSERMAPPAT